MTGNSTTLAPSERKKSHSDSDCSFARVTTIVRSTKKPLIVSLVTHDRLECQGDFVQHSSRGSGFLDLFL